MKLNFDNETGRSFLSYTLLHYNIGIVYFTSSNSTSSTPPLLLLPGAEPGC